MKKLFVVLGVLAVIAAATVAVIGYGGLLRRAVPEMQRAKVPPPAARSAPYRDSMEALAHLDFEAIDPMTMQREEIRFARGIEQILQGQLDQAAGLFASLESAPPPLRDDSLEILQNLLVAERRWEEAAELAARVTDAGARTGGAIGVESTRVFARGLAGAPAERYRFPSEPVTVPMRIDWFGLPRITIRVGDCDLVVIPDTGASQTSLSSSAAARCGVTVRGDETARAFTATDHTVEVRPALIDRVRIGDLVIENHPAAILSEGALPRVLRIDGVLGWPVFQNARITMDYAGNRMTLERPSSFPVPPAERNFFWLGYPMVIGRSEQGVPIVLGLDTGAAGTSISDEIFQKISFDEIGTGGGFRIGAGGSQRVDSRTVGELTLFLGGWRLRFEDVRSADRAKGAVFLLPDGLLGSNALRRGSAVFDFANGRLELMTP